MRTDTKALISKLTLQLLNFTAILFVLGMVVVLVCTGLNINPFRETTTSILIAFFVGLIGLSAVLVLVNVATNMSIIADAKIKDMKLQPESRRIRKWIGMFLAIVVVLVTLIFTSTFYSKEKYMGIVRSQSEKVTQENTAQLEQISTLLASNDVEDFKKINEIKEFLERQKKELPYLTIIYSRDVIGKPALYQTQDYYSDTTLDHAYYSCSGSVDCDYLANFFAGKPTQKMEKYKMNDDKFSIYIPYIGKNNRFIMLFQKYNQYGKLGSGSY